MKFPLSFRSAAALCVAIISLSFTSNLHAEEGYIRVRHEAAAQAGELSLDATYTLWIPEGLGEKKLRGVIVHQHGCGEGASKGGQTGAYDLHWQALARKWDFALLAPVYHQKEKENCRNWCDPRNGSDAAFLKALETLAQRSGHPELQTVPWCLWGHSGGGFWASIMLALHPERIAAIWFRSGTALSAWEKGEIAKPEFPPASNGVPVMFNPGRKEKDDKRFGRAWDGSLAHWRALRALGAPAGFAPDPHTSHECGDSRYLAIPFFDACLGLRLAAPNATNSALKAVDLKKGVFAPLEGNTFSKTVAEPAEASWLPNETFAKAWSEYITDGAVIDATPPPAPFGLSARFSEGRWLLDWQADADLQSGLAGFVIEKDGLEIARLPEKAENRYGRPIFQGMSYHDTPEVPKDPKVAAAWLPAADDPFQNKLPAMHFEVPVDAQSVPVWSVRAVNTVGLRSLPAFPKTLGAKAFVACDYAGGKVAKVNADGTVAWSVPAKNPQDCWVQPDGGVLYCEAGGAVRLDAKQQRIWEYKAAPGVECHACQLLENGRVLIAEGGPKRLIEVAPDGTVALEIPLPTTITNAHNQIRGARKLANGHYVAALKGDSKVVEIDATGKVVREVSVVGDPHEVVPLKDGNWLITCGDGHRVVEVDPKGSLVWELNENDMPDFPLRLIAGAQRLQNGNTVLCNYLGHGHIGMQPQFVEVTREKEIVWRFDDHRHFKTINQIHVMEEPEKGPPVR